MIQPADSSEKQEPKRDQHGRYLPGVSGNPSGPKGGFKHKATLSRIVQEHKGKNNKEFWAEVKDIALAQARLGNTALLCKIVDKLVSDESPELEELDEIPRQLPIVKLYADGRN